VLRGSAFVQPVGGRGTALRADEPDVTKGTQAHMLKNILSIVAHVVNRVYTCSHIRCPILTP
jgi:hypothetical protein